MGGCGAEAGVPAEGGLIPITSMITPTRSRRYQIDTYAGLGEVGSGELPGLGALVRDC